MKANKVDKKFISATLRDSGKQRLLNAMKQNQHLSSTLQMDFVTSAETLEIECYLKYGKSGKSIYLSQMASTARWLSAAVSDELTQRLGTTPSMATEADKPEADRSLSPSAPFVAAITPVHEENGSGSGATVESNSAVLEHTLPPPILSFSEFINRRKVMDKQVSTSKRESKDGVSQGMEKKAKC